jgi:hypothetical protein
MSSPSGYAAGNQAISGYKTQQLPTMTPQMQQLFQSLLGGAGGGANAGLSHLSGLASGNQSSFEEQEAPAYAAFNKTLGQVGSKYSFYNAQDSSAFQNALAGEGGKLAQNLQGQRSDIRNNAIKDLLGFSNQLLGKNPFENVLQKEDEGFDFGGLLGQVLPQLLKLFL